LHAKGWAKIEATPAKEWHNAESDEILNARYDEYKNKFENFIFTVVPSQWRKLRDYLPKKSKRIFVGSQTDISIAPYSELLRLKIAIENDNKKRAMNFLPLHQFQFLTQDPAVYKKMKDFPLNCWFGITATNSTELESRRRCLLDAIGRENTDRIDYVYLEPLIGHFRDTKHWTTYPAWIVTGGMSRQNGVPPIMADVESVRNIRDWAKEFGIPFYFKGWGALLPSGQEPGKLDGVEYHEFPPSVEVV
jgi:protein gp37